MLKDNERFIELVHGKTRYFEMGSGKALILLHGVGYTSGATSWLKNIEALSQRFRVLAPDMLGWGTGGRVQRHLAFPYLVEFLRQFQDALSIERSHLVGHSLGGWVSQIFSYESPQRVEQLVLVASAGHDSHVIPAALKNFQVPAREQLQAEVAAIPGLSEREASEWFEALCQNISAPDSAACYRSMLEYMTFMEERDRYITPRLWPRISAKTLIISGTDDLAYPPEVGEQMAAAIPDALQLVLEAGHMIPQEVPQEMNQAILDFLH